MLEKPSVSDEYLVTCLDDEFGIAVKALVFQPIGNDPHSWAYYITAQDGERWFLKVREGDVNRGALIVPRYLRDAGISQVVAPKPTRRGTLRADAGAFSLIVYPFIDGQTGYAAGMTDDHWIELGRTLRAVHDMHLPPQIEQYVLHETFTSRWLDVAERLHMDMASYKVVNPYQHELAQFWLSRSDEIITIINRLRELGKLLASEPQPFVLCHADIHIFNVLIDRAGELHIVDWDEIIIAPRERDLMFVRGNDCVAPLTAAQSRFVEGYGLADCDQLKLAYYRYDWVVQEIADYGERVFMKAGVGAETLRDAVDSFVRLFDEGNVVESAYLTDKN